MQPSNAPRVCAFDAARTACTLHSCAIQIDNRTSGVTSTIQLIDLLGAGALLLWGLRLIKSGVMRAFGASLRLWIAHGTGNRFTSVLSGLVATLALQSSTATAVITASFAARGIINPRMGQAVMLGANVGTSIAAVVLSLNVHWFASVLILVGVATFSLSEQTRGKGVGRALLGLGLMLLALQLMGSVTEPMRDSPLVAAILQGLSDAPVFALIFAAGLALMASSSLAVVLFVALMAQSGLLSVSLVLTLVAGANLGGAIPPVLAVLREGAAARRLTISNLVVRGVGALAAVLLAPVLAPWLAGLALDAKALTIGAHIGFNLGLLIIFLPFTAVVARLAERLIKTSPDATERQPNYLDDTVLDTPAVALAGAARETLRIGDLLRTMLEESLKALERTDPDARATVARLDDDVDRLHEAVKLYLSRLNRTDLDPDDARRSNEIIAYAINLEHVGDIIDNGLSQMAGKKAKRQVRFSPEGLAEISALFACTIENLRLSQSVFFSRDPDLARQLVAAKVEVRRLESASAEHHLDRMRAQRAETLETSGMHLDVLRDLKRINAHLTAVAYPILEERGALRESRLRPEPEDASAVPSTPQ